MDKLEIKDVFGIEPIGEAGLKITQATIDGVSAFLEAVCKPCLEELGFLIKDKVRFWRLNNILRMLDKAKGKMHFEDGELQLTANARVGLNIMEGCSEVDNEELQDLWAGLFVSSCTPDGKDDSNMNFVDILRRMSSVEAKIVDYACSKSTKYIYPNKLIIADRLFVSFETLTSIAGTDDIYRLDSELDHMRSIELLNQGDALDGAGGGFIITDSTPEANITPSALALNLYFRTHSTGITPQEFWGDKLISCNEADDEQRQQETLDKMFTDIKGK